MFDFKFHLPVHSRVIQIPLEGIHPPALHTVNTKIYHEVIKLFS